ncbi:hypothetical protein B0H14DRAFT_2616445 [Mycena olivaceomarginata]|nr:hypothetical protein B0H14DRAFT_2616445 [Mycena olivaceomarginata]
MGRYGQTDSANVRILISEWNVQHMGTPQLNTHVRRSEGDVPIVPKSKCDCEKCCGYPNCARDYAPSKKLGAGRPLRAVNPATTCFSQTRSNTGDYSVSRAASVYIPAESSSLDGSEHYDGCCNAGKPLLTIHRVVLHLFELLMKKEHVVIHALWEPQFNRAVLNKPKDNCLQLGFKPGRGDQFRTWMNKGGKWTCVGGD